MKEKYILEETTCPECGGEGRIETMTWLTYDGAQSWKVENCQHCNGDRVSLEPVKCPLCGDEILVEESTIKEGMHFHGFCLEEEKENA